MVDLNSPEWLATRQKNVGGSEVAALFDLPPEDRPAYLLTRFALWHIKAGNADPPPVDEELTEVGQILEPAIAKLTARRQGWTVSKGGYVADPKTPGMGCTLDYVIESDEQEDGPGCLELKNVGWLVHKDSWLDDEPPLHILLQLQHQLACTGYKWGAVSALVGGNKLHVYRYHRREPIIEDIRRRVKEFWQSIRDGREPPVDGSAGATSVLRQLYPDPSNNFIDMSESNTWPGVCAEFQAAAAAKTAANNRYDLARNQLAAMMGDYKRAYGNGYRVQMTVTPAKLPRLPNPGELIPGRAESRRYTIKETR